MIEGDKGLDEGMGGGWAVGERGDCRGPFESLKRLEGGLLLED